MRQKEEAMRKADHAAKHETVDGSPKRSEHMSHMAHTMGAQTERSVKEELS